MPRSKRAREEVSPRKSAVQERSRETVRVILEGAAQVLEREGYAATTTEAIAERAGVSVGTLYQYFPNKDALLLTLARCHALEAYQLLEPRIRELIERPPELRAGLGGLIQTCLELNGRRPRLHQVLFEETPFPPEVLQEMTTSGELLLRLIAHYLSHAPGARVANARLAAYLTLRSIGSIFHSVLLERPDDLPIEACAAGLQEMLEPYLSGSNSRGPSEGLDLASRFIVYAEDFERAFETRAWSSLAHHFTEDAIYECKHLGFRAEGRDQLLAQFEEMSRFDRGFDSREMRLQPPRRDGSNVFVKGTATYRVRDAPPFELHFEEIAEYRGPQIARLEDKASPEVIAALMSWMSQHGDKLARP